jgi:predicted ribosomally synthesized peptide with SipW-like signal peptide
MNKKRIILSLSIIGIVAAIVIGGTIAYFSDTEASTGNILVAGSLDLKVDHTRQTYNGVDCKTCKVEIVSDTSNEVVSTDGGHDLALPHNAVAVSNPHSAWTVSIPDATWIWATDPTLQDDTTEDITYTFRKTFVWQGPFIGATLNLSVGADNGYQVWVNGVNLVGDPGEFNYQSPADQYTEVDISNIVSGINTLEIKVTNKGMVNGTPETNPGGLLYKLTIDGNCEDDYFKQNCQLWGLKDLEDEKFFNFEDVKPGDSGTNVISLHVYNNDAWVCMSAGNVVNDENGLQEPELEMIPADDGTTGELGKNINIFMWRDLDNDGEYDAGESSLGSYTLAGDFIIPLYDSTSAGGTLPLDGDTDAYVGLAWCAGNLTATEGLPFECDGSSMDNYSQSDTVTADLIFRAEQFRNQPDFTCVVPQE